MKLEHYPVKKLKKEILGIVKKHLDLKRYQLFFFGSRVQGKGDERSDIDIGIEGRSPVPLEIISEIQEETSNLPILYRIDIVDFRDADRNFYEVAKQNIEIIT